MSASSNNVDANQFNSTSFSSATANGTFSSSNNNNNPNLTASLHPDQIFAAIQKEAETLKKMKKLFMDELENVKCQQQIVEKMIQQNSNSTAAGNNTAAISGYNMFRQNPTTHTDTTTTSSQSQNFQ
jgi:hypothetical protein